MTTGERELADVDVVVVGGGPGGLNAALVLSRARKRVLLCDAGTRRNAMAEHIHNFVTRDGTPPDEFRRVAREQLVPYDVAVRNERVAAIAPDSLGFRVTLETGTEVHTKRVVLATGMVDVPLDVPGMRDAWGRSVFQCPFCHGFEVRDLIWGVLVSSEPMLDFARMLTGWTSRVVAFTHGAFEVSDEARQQLIGAGMPLEQRPIRRLVLGEGGELRGIELVDGTTTRVDVLFTKPKQHLPVPVKSLRLALTEAGYVRVNEKQETSVPGVFAVGDLTTPAQAAVLAAAAGAVAGFAIVHDLNLGAKLARP